jgi:hypothetical protein
MDCSPRGAREHQVAGAQEGGGRRWGGVVADGEQETPLDRERGWRGEKQGASGSVGLEAFF